MNINYHCGVNKLFAYLVLDYNRMDELYRCLQSIRQNTRIERSKYSVIVLANGGDKRYHDNCYGMFSEGFCDELIIRRENKGSGFGQEELYKFCDEKYVIFVQSDQVLIKGIGEEFIEQLVKNLTGDVKCIDLAEQHCGENVYSERASFMEREFYNSIPNKPHGGPGPYHHLPWNEGYVQKYFHDNKYVVQFIKPIIFGDLGQVARRTNPDGSEWVHHTDTKRQWLIKGPIKEKYCYPNFSEKEWTYVLKNQSWPDGEIPEEEKKFSFEFYPDESELPKLQK